MVASRAIGSLRRFTNASRTLRCPGEAWLRVPWSPWHNASDPRPPLAAPSLPPPGAPALDWGRGGGVWGDAALRPGLLCPWERTVTSSLATPSPASISGFVTSNVSESCPPVWHFLQVSRSHLWALAPLFFNDGLEPVATRSGVPGLGHSSLSHLYAFTATCPYQELA